MIDTFGRSVTYLRVSVTDLCNLRCRYCMPEDGVCKKEHADMLTEDEFIQAVEAAVALALPSCALQVENHLLKRISCLSAAEQPEFLEFGRSV